MLAEGFLRVLLYREERKCVSASRRHKAQTHPHYADNCISTDSTDLQSVSAAAGSNQEEFDSNKAQELRVVPPGPVGRSMPRRSPALTFYPNLKVCIDDCSLLDQYPDLQVADSGLVSHHPLRATVAPQGSYAQPGRGEPASPIPDQGYLVMGDSMNLSLGLPGSGLEPMSNSVLNGLLDKQLEEVYMQHLTDNLARCNSQAGNSLLHGLVPPPQGPHSLETSLEAGPVEKKISYLSTQTLVPCSSNFSTPVLKISEDAEV